MCQKYAASPHVINLVFLEAGIFENTGAWKLDIYRNSSKVYWMYHVLKSMLWGHLEWLIGAEEKKIEAGGYFVALAKLFEIQVIDLADD